MKIQGQLAVISGGSQGLGKSLAKLIVQEGGNAVIVSRTESKLKAVVDELVALRVHDDQHISYVTADVSKGHECQMAFEKIEQVPDIVFCCAGGASPGMFVDMEPEQLDKDMNIVYNTAMHFSHAALRVMSKADTTKRRNLVFCSSILAMFSFIGYGSYAPGKAAIRALADILREECIPYNIGVANIVAGNMKTEGFEQEEKTKPEITRKIEGPSAAKDPDDVAKQVLKDLRKDREMIYTDFIGWVLSGLMMGTSPRSSGIFQTIIAIFLTIFAPIIHWSIRRDIRSYFDKKQNKSD